MNSKSTAMARPAPDSPQDSAAPERVRSQSAFLRYRAGAMDSSS
jgi:hypothetical protein